MFDCVLQIGHKWDLIAQRLPGRTDKATKSRYERLLVVSDAARGQ